MIVARKELRFRRLRGRRSADPFEGKPIAGLSVRVVHLDGRARRAPHRHPYSYEVMYVVSGSGHLWADGRFHRVVAGDCVAVPPGTAHATLPERGTEMELVCFFPHGDLHDNIEELPEPKDLGALREDR